MCRTGRSHRSINTDRGRMLPYGIELGGAGGERLAEALARGFELVEVRRLLDHLEVDDALAEAVERVRADDRVARHARLAGAGADLADELALQALVVELALA